MRTETDGQQAATTHYTLAQVLASRICHDLVNPIGAIANGTDLLGEVAGPQLGEEVEMIGQSASRAAAVLAFHRIAFGAADDASVMARAQVATLAERLIASHRVGFGASGLEGEALPRRHARLAALMVLAGNALLPMKGTLRLDFEPTTETGLPISVTVSGPNLERKADLIDLINTPAAEPDPRQVEFALLRPAATATGADLNVRRAPEAIVLEAQPRR